MERSHSWLYAARMPEHAHDPRRADSGGLRTPPVEEWDSWPFEGGVTPRALRAAEPEPDRNGEGTRPCTACSTDDADYIWTSERWRLRTLPPSGLPVVLLLEPRAHVDSPRDLPDDQLAEMGILLAHVERAVLAIDGVERVHILRYGEGSAHLHWWFMGRPTGLRQTASGVAMIWDDVLPPTPDDIHRANLATVAAAMDASAPS
jgi:diadenosine tetraphosphate (Ap4A) HIT family hydrolase